jgi:hypothetical protein
VKSSFKLDRLVERFLIRYGRHDTRAWYSVRVYWHDLANIIFITTLALILIPSLMCGELTDRFINQTISSWTFTQLKMDTKSYSPRSYILNIKTRQDRDKKETQSSVCYGTNIGKLVRCFIFNHHL